MSLLVSKEQVIEKESDLNGGNIRWDTYCGWLVEGENYQNKYAVLCYKNREEDYCPAQHEDCPYNQYKKYERIGFKDKNDKQICVGDKVRHEQGYEDGIVTYKNNSDMGEYFVCSNWRCFLISPTSSHAPEKLEVINENG